MRDALENRECFTEVYMNEANKKKKTKELSCLQSSLHGAIDIFNLFVSAV